MIRLLLGDFRCALDERLSIRPLLSDFRCTFDGRLLIADFDFRASGDWMALQLIEIFCVPAWMTSFASGESLRCLNLDFVPDQGLLVVSAGDFTVGDSLLCPARTTSFGAGQSILCLS